MRPATPSQGSVTLDVFFVRLPYGDAEGNGPLWDDVDEAALPQDLRDRLESNGLRAGHIGGHVPSALARMLHLTDAPPPKDASDQAVPLLSEPTVRRQLVQLPNGHGRIQVSDVYQRLPLLLHEDGQVRGAPYRAAQGLIDVQADIQEDGRVRLRLTPELHHGQPKQQYRPNAQEGVIRFEMAREKRTLESLQIESVLAPGEMLTLTCHPNRLGSLGSYFFSDGSDRGKEQKLLVLRLAQAPHRALDSENTHP